MFFFYFGYPNPTPIPSLIHQPHEDLTEPLQQQLVERLAHLASTFEQWQRAASCETIEAPAPGSDHIFGDVMM